MLKTLERTYNQFPVEFKLTYWAIITGLCDGNNLNVQGMQKMKLLRIVP